MAVVAQNVYDRASIFSATGLYPQSETKVNLFIADAELRVARDLWGEVADLAVIYLTAHLLYLDVLINNSPIIQSASSVTGGAVGGTIGSMGVGPLSVSYNSTGMLSSGGENAFSDDSMATTPFGKRYIELRDEQMLRGYY